MFAELIERSPLRNRPIRFCPDSYGDPRYVIFEWRLSGSATTFVRENRKRWIETNPDKRREKNRRWFKVNPDKKREDNQRWKKANPETVRAGWRREDQRKTSNQAVMQSPDKVYGLIPSALPSGFPRHVRNDVAGSLCLTIMEKKVLVKNIKAEIGNFLKAYNCEYDTFQTLSLDAMILGTKTTYLDALVAG